MTMKKCKLPKRPSTLIARAVKDLEKVERDPLYTVSMGEWHSGSRSKSTPCAVCFAGSVMAKTCELPRSATFGVYDEQFDQETIAKFEALNSFRGGLVYDGLEYMGLTDKFDRSKMPVSVPVREYASDPEAFKAQMRGLAAGLKKVGL